MSLRYLYNVADKHIQNYRAKWEAARLSGVITLLLNADKDGEIDPASVYRFPWEPVRQKPRLEMTPELLERLKRFDAETTHPSEWKNALPLDAVDIAKFSK